MTTPYPAPSVPQLERDANWRLPRQEFVVALALLCSETFLAIVTNIALIVTIWHSPSLKTPPNAYLVNICVNNLLLTLSMVVSFTSLLCTAETTDSIAIPILGGIQRFLCTLCMLQYWCIFSAIGFYRSRTIKKPSMTLKARKTTIRRTIVAGWSLSVSLAVGITIAFCRSPSVLSWNPMVRSVNGTDILQMEEPNGGQSTMLTLALLLVIVSVGVLCNSYYWILRELHVTTPAVQNRVSPWTRASSISSDENDLVVQKRSYLPEAEPRRPPFIISNGKTGGADIIVHYDKRSQSLTFQEEVVALEYPVRAQSSYQNHRKLRQTLSNGSAQGTEGSPKLRGAAFTDISPGAELQRFQRLKNHCALRNQSWRKDRTSLSGATKNSLVMLATFLVCSLPLVVTSIPTVLPVDNVHSFNTALLFSTLVFYLNAPAYPAWYLVCSKRVRKCLTRLFESALIKLNMRR